MHITHHNNLAIFSKMLTFHLFYSAMLHVVMGVSLVVCSADTRLPMLLLLIATVTHCLHQLGQESAAWEHVRTGSTDHGAR